MKHLSGTTALLLVLLTAPVWAEPIRVTGRIETSSASDALPAAIVWQADLDPAANVPWAWTGAGGSFRLALLGPEPSLGVASAGHVTIPRQLVDPAGGLLSLALRPSVSVAGQVVDADGRPVPGAVVHTEPTTFTGQMETREARAGADGRFRLRGLAPQSYRLTVKAEGFVSAWQELALEEADKAVPPIHIVLSRGLLLAGRLVDPAGQPGWHLPVDRLRP